MKKPLKLSKSTYLLILLIEECAEIIHRTCKAIRFGLEERQSSPSGVSEETNIERLAGEIDDFETVKDLLYFENTLNVTTGPRLSKKTKIEKYMKYSAEECETLDLNERNAS